MNGKNLECIKVTRSNLDCCPHRDDDVLGTGGLIQIARHLGKRIYVLYMTVGDANSDSVSHFLHKPLRPRWFRKLEYMRHGEALRADSLGYLRHIYSF